MCIQERVEKILNVEEYYDKLEYYKWKTLQGQAKEVGEIDRARKYGRLARKTMYGINPFERFEVVK